MRKVLILGGGFGGTKALAKLSRSPCEVTLVDPKVGFDFLPALPDLLSRKFGGSHLGTLHQTDHGPEPRTGLA